MSQYAPKQFLFLTYVDLGDWLKPMFSYSVLVTKNFGFAMEKWLKNFQSTLVFMKNESQQCPVNS